MISQPDQKQEQDKAAGKFSLSLGGQILLLTCGLVFMTALLMGGLYFSQSVSSAVDREYRALSFETELMAPQFQAAFDLMENDVRVLSKLPPIQGFVRSSANDGIDPRDGSTTQLWHDRLSQIFMAFIRSNESYIQIRYIGVADNGRELVRVNRTKEGFEIIAQDDMQSKGDEPYFKEGLQLAPGEIFFSHMSLNREHGVVQVPHVPVIRAILPVYAVGTDEIFGMIVINARYETLLHEAVKRIRPRENLYVIDDSGSFFVYGKEKKQVDFYMAGTAKEETENVKILKSLMESKSSSDTLSVTENGTEKIVHFRKIFFDPNSADRFLILAYSLPKDLMLAAPRKVMRQSLILAVLLIFASSLCAAMLTYFVRKPLQKTIDGVRQYARGENPSGLPLDRNDEIGELARAFSSMTENLEVSRRAEQETLESLNQKKKELEKSERRLQLILDNAGEGIYGLNIDGTTTFANKAAEDILGYKQEDLLNKNQHELIHHSHADGEVYPKEECKIYATFKSGKACNEDGEVFWHKDGYPVPIEYTGKPVFDSKGRITGAVVVFRDITERKKAEEEILRSNEELSRFAYIASHDLQEPLRMISSFTSLLDKEYKDKLDDKGQQYMKFISGSAHRMSALISDILEYSMANASGVELAEFDAREAVGTALMNLQQVIDDTEAKVTVDNMPAIYGSPVKFSSLIQNLVGNAIKYRDKDKKPEIHVGVEDQGRNWLFSIKDNGIGMKEEYLSQIFVLFKRLHHKNEYSGTGIGLSICKKIVEGLGGEIWAESEYGKGSIFYFTVPKRGEEKNVA